MSHVVKVIEDVDIALNKCPFCGGYPEWVEVEGYDYIMRCSCCHASTRVARFTAEEAAHDWNSLDIDDDNYTIAEDTPIDEYFKQHIKKVLFSKYSVWEPFPSVNGGFLCSEAVVVTDKTIIGIDTECSVLLYDELSGYGYDYYTKSVTDTDEEIHFVKSEWKDRKLLSVLFKCKDKTVKISACAEDECMMVTEE